MDSRVWIKWVSVSEYVDIETGEMISKARAKREYNELFKTKIIKIDGNKGEIKWRNECEKSRQTKICFGGN